MLPKRLNKYAINNLIITCKFFNAITKSCEFMINSSNDDKDELTLKKIYFIIDPRVYLISNSNMNNFLLEVDRDSSTTKLKGLNSQLNYFLSEIEYKYKHIKKSNILKWMLEVEYNYADKLNFWFAMTINAIILIFLEKDYNNPGVYYTVVSIALLQILMNVIYMLFFLISKWKFYVILEKSKIDKKNLSVIDWLNMYVFQSFIFNEEIYIMLLNIIIGSVASLTYYTTFFVWIAIAYDY